MRENLGNHCEDGRIRTCDTCVTTKLAHNSYANPPPAIIELQSTENPAVLNLKEWDRTVFAHTGSVSALRILKIVRIVELKRFL